MEFVDTILTYILRFVFLSIFIGSAIYGAYKELKWEKEHRGKH